jgi:hypothetical protein
LSIPPVSILALFLIETTSVPRPRNIQAQEPIDARYDGKYYGIVIQISQLLLSAIFTVLGTEICIEVQGIEGYWQTTEIQRCNHDTEP